MARPLRAQLRNRQANAGPRLGQRFPHWPGLMAAMGHLVHHAGKQLSVVPTPHDPSPATAFKLAPHQQQIAADVLTFSLAFSFFAACFLACLRVARNPWTTGPKTTPSLSPFHFERGHCMSWSVRPLVRLCVRGLVYIHMYVCRRCPVII